MLDLLTWRRGFVHWLGIRNYPVRSTVSLRCVKVQQDTFLHRARRRATLWAMSTTFYSLRSGGLRLLAFGLTLALATSVLPTASMANESGKAKGKATDRVVSTPPLTVSFERAPATDTPPYVLKVTNASNKALKLKGHVLLSVAAHNQDRARQLPEQDLRRNQSFTVDTLAAHDRVVLQVEGFAPLVLVVPETKQ
jgi:hypothetical protein